MTDACLEFEEHLEDLAVGDVAEPERSRLLAHAATCRDCRSHLDSLLVLTDRLLDLAPQHEPPPGFESRVLAGLGAAGGAVTARPPRRRWLAFAGAAAVVLALLGGFLLGARRPEADDSVARSGVITTSGGSRVGSIELIDAATPYALVLIDRPQPGEQRVSCQLVLADGRAVTVGSWGYDDVKAGVWAVGVPEPLLAAVSMRIVDEQGLVLAIASLSG